jgi:hypothetical protein
VAVASAPNQRGSTMSVFCVRPAPMVRGIRCDAVVRDRSHVIVTKVGHSPRKLLILFDAKIAPKLAYAAEITP